MPPLVQLIQNHQQGIHRRQNDGCSGWNCLSSGTQFGIILTIAAVVLIVAYLYWRFKLKDIVKNKESDQSPSRSARLEVRRSPHHISITIYREPTDSSNSDEEEEAASRRRSSRQRGSTRTTALCDRETGRERSRSTRRSRQSLPETTDSLAMTDIPPPPPPPPVIQGPAVFGPEIVYPPPIHVVPPPPPPVVFLTPVTSAGPPPPPYYPPPPPPAAAPGPPPGPTQPNQPGWSLAAFPPQPDGHGPSPYQQHPDLHGPAHYQGPPDGWETAANPPQTTDAYDPPQATYTYAKPPPADSSHMPRADTSATGPSYPREPQQESRPRGDMGVNGSGSPSPEHRGSWHGWSFLRNIRFPPMGHARTLTNSSTSSARDSQPGSLSGPPRLPEPSNSGQSERHERSDEGNHERNPERNSERDREEGSPETNRSTSRSRSHSPSHLDDNTDSYSNRTQIHHSPPPSYSSSEETPYFDSPTTSTRATVRFNPSPHPGTSLDVNSSLSYETPSSSVISRYRERLNNLDPTHPTEGRPPPPHRDRRDNHGPAQGDGSPSTSSTTRRRRHPSPDIQFPSPERRRARVGSAEESRRGRGRASLSAPRPRDRNRVRRRYDDGRRHRRRRRETRGRRDDERNRRERSRDRDGLLDRAMGILYRVRRALREE